MNRARRVWPFLILVLALFASSARGSSSTTDITDMWWNPSESGWGLNIILQNDIAFLTFFVYDDAGDPVWYASNAQFSNADFTWSGDLYAYRGPWFGGAFSPVTPRKAGTVSFTVSGLDQGTLTYTVDGVTVTKALQRLTWANEDYSGNYLGGYSISDANCTSSNLNGLEEAGGFMTVTQNGSAFSMTSTTSGGTCTYSGSYGQSGKLGQVLGNFACTNGVQGQFALQEMNPTISGFTARFIGQNQFCQFNGYIGGVRRSG